MIYPYRRTVPYRTRHHVWRRDRATCGLCGQRILRRAFTVDHVRPRRHGGLNFAWNLRAAHRVCNEVRGCTFTMRDRLTILRLAARTAAYRLWVALA